MLSMRLAASKPGALTDRTSVQASDHGRGPKPWLVQSSPETTCRNACAVLSVKMTNFMGDVAASKLLISLHEAAQRQRLLATLHSIHSLISIKRLTWSAHVLIKATDVSCKQLSLTNLVMDVQWPASLPLRSRSAQSHNLAKRSPCNGSTKLTEGHAQHEGVLSKKRRSEKYSSCKSRNGSGLFSA